MRNDRKQKEYDFKRNLIIDAAREIFFEKGFDNSTMADIAKKAGYSKGSIYSYFNSKNEICFHIFNAHFEKIITRIKTITNSDLNGLAKLKKIKKVFVNEFLKKSNFSKIIDSFKHHRNQCLQTTKEIEKNSSLTSEINSCFNDVINAGIKDKSIKANTDSEKLANALWNEENGFFTELKADDRNNYLYLFDLIIDSIKGETNND